MGNQIVGDNSKSNQAKEDAKTQNEDVELGNEIKSKEEPCQDIDEKLTNEQLTALSENLQKLLMANMARGAVKERATRGIHEDVQRLSTKEYYGPYKGKLGTTWQIH